MAEQYEITTIILRKGLEEDRNNITPTEGELLYIIDTNQIYVGDGATPGGIRVSGGTVSIGDDVELILTAGNGLVGGGPLGEEETLISLGTPSTITGASLNSVTEYNHTHEIDATDARDVTNNTQLLLAKAMKDHIDNEPHSTGSGGSVDCTQCDHNLLQNYNANQHINHSNVELLAGDGLSGGGNLLESRTISLGTPTTLSATTTNALTSGSHTHNIESTDSRNVTNDTSLLLAKAMKDHIDNEPHVLISHTHDHNALTNYIANEHVNHQAVNISSGNGLTGGGAITSSQTIALGQPSSISGSSINSATQNSHTHNIIATDARDITDSSKLLLAKAMKDHIQYEFHGQTDGTDHTHNHNLLEHYEANEHVDHTTINIIAGNGLTSGGNISNDVTIDLTVPGQLSGTTTNIADGNHTHSIEATDSRDVTNDTSLLLAKAMKDHIDNEVHATPDGTNHAHSHDDLLNIDSNEHLDHTTINITAGNGLTGGGDISSSVTIDLTTPGQLSGATINDASSNHTHSISVSDSRTISDTSTILLAKAMKDHIENEPHVLSGHNHDHNVLTNYITNEHINHTTINITAGNGLTGGGDISSSVTIDLTTPGQLSGTTTNDASSNHTHSIETTDSRNVTNDTSLLLAKAMKDHIDNETHVAPDGTNHNHEHDELLGYDSNHHVDHTMLSILAGDGLIGGGTLLETKTLTLGIPTTLSADTVNAVFSETHTHNIDATDSRTTTNTSSLLLAKAMKDHIDEEEHVIPDGSNHVHAHSDLTDIISNEHINHTTIDITAGNGLNGGGNISQSREITLGEPSTLSGMTSNSLSTNTHTHEITCSDTPIDDNQTLLLAKGIITHTTTDDHIPYEMFSLNFDIVEYSGSNIFQLATPGTLSGTSVNDSFFHHRHEITTSDAQDITDESTIFLAKGMSDHIANFRHPKKDIYDNISVTSGSYYEKLISDLSFIPSNIDHLIIIVYVYDSGLSGWITNTSDYPYVVFKNKSTEGDAIRIYNNHTSDLTFQIHICE